ncbi:MAG TPA: 5-oxoprolinase subunit PxpA [Thermoanaerobaculia bacterium]
MSADMGEGASGEPEIWPLIDAANVACGGHAGDAQSMREAARCARQHGVAIGAHPSYPDRANFGRTSIKMDPAALRETLVEQIAAIAAITPLRHIKAHGALYNDAHRDRALAEILLDAGGNLPIVCSATSQMAAVARERGVRVVREAFADRRYEPDGSLTPRNIPGSLLTIEEAAAQARLLATEGVVIARDGSRVAVACDTLCIHADMAGSADRLRAIRAAL